ncbi:MAG: hypothetical protein U5K79_06615 [Cyclobacteriaceae bacterium]|nr:hypothetical protein [Cyclobacteriaceae bacterium]
MTRKKSHKQHLPKLAAVVYGPILLAGDIGTELMPTSAPIANDQLDYRNAPMPDDIISSLDIKGKKLGDWLVPVQGKPRVFKTSGVASREITLAPFYQITNQRYVLYWNLQ